MHYAISLLFPYVFYNSETQTYALSKICIIMLCAIRISTVVVYVMCSNIVIVICWCAGLTYMLHLANKVVIRLEMNSSTVTHNSFGVNPDVNHIHYKVPDLA